MAGWAGDNQGRSHLCEAPSVFSAPSEQVSTKYNLSQDGTLQPVVYRPPCLGHRIHKTIHDFKKE